MNIGTNYPLHPADNTTAVYQELLDEAHKHIKGMNKAEKEATRAALEEQARVTGMNPSAYDDMANALTKGGGVTTKAGNWKELLTGKGAKAAGAGLAIQLVLMYAISKGSSIMGIHQQTGAIERQTANLSPNDMLYQAMIPDLQAKSQLARQALMNQLGGVTGPSQLASGESYVGG